MLILNGLVATTLAALRAVSAEPLVVTPPEIPLPLHQPRRSIKPGLMNGSPPLKLIENVPTNSLTLRRAFCHSSIVISWVYCLSLKYSQYRHFTLQCSFTKP